MSLPQSPSLPKRVFVWFAQAAAYTGGLAILLTLTFLALRVSPVLAFKALISGAIGDPQNGYWYAISETLVETTPLILTGLGVAVAWRAGMFSIGAEGQLLVGALAAVALWTAAGRLPAPLLMTLMLAVGSLAGAGWSALAGWLRVRRNVPEVISTIMLNYIALNIIRWLVSDSGRLHGKSQSDPHSDPLPKALLLPKLIPIAWSSDIQTRLHLGFLLALLVVPAVSLYLYRTRAGFGVRLLGQNPEAARAARFPIDWLRMQAMAVSGALCGLAGVIELLRSDTGRLGGDFSPGWGFTAIPVALLGGLSPLGTLFSALFFGALAAGTSNAQQTPNVGVPSVVAYVIQAATVLAIVGARAWQHRKAGTETD